MRSFLTGLFKSRKSGWRLWDPRATAAENPYTFFTPPKAEIQALEPGDLVKLTFEATGPGAQATERMWVEWQGQTEAGNFGRLDNQPFDIPGLNLNDHIEFQDFHIVSKWAFKFEDPETDQFEAAMFARARVSPDILSGKSKIHKAERLEPRNQPGIDFPDTGWHFYATNSAANNDMEFVAIGVILNQDASVLPHLKSPLGTVLYRNPDSDDGFLPE